MAKRIMRSLLLDEISGVDFPAQTGAKVAIFKSGFGDEEYSALCKRKFTADERRAAEANGHAMPGGRYPINDKSDLENAIRAVGEGKGSHAAIRAHIKTRAQALGASDLIPEAWKASNDAEKREQITRAVAALAKSFDAIEKSSEGEARATLLCETSAEFMKHIQGIVPEGAGDAFVASSLKAAGFKIDGIAIAKEDNDAVNKEILKALGLSETASEAEVLKAIVAIAKKETDEEKKKREEAEKALKSLELIAKLSGKHKDYMDTEGAKMPSGGKEAFLSMTPAERDAHIKANPANEDDDDDKAEKAIKSGKAFKASNGTVVYAKSFSDAAAFEAAKADAAEIIKNRTDIAVMKDREGLATVLKSVEPLKNVGKADDVAGLLHRIGKRDQKDADAVLAIFKQMDTAVTKSGLFNEHGSNQQGRVGKAAESIQKAAEELKKANPKWSIEKARDEARKANPALKAEEDAEREEDRNLRAGKRAA